MKDNYFKHFILAWVIFPLGTSSCQPTENRKENQAQKQNNKMEEEYSWSPGADAPNEYPAEVISGYFYKGEEIAFVPNGSVVNSGWGQDGMQMRGASFIPEGLNITFLSFVENKFYEGDFKLPKDVILDYFRKGYTDFDTKKKVTYHNMYIGLAPGGMVVLWMAGNRSNQVEIGRFQATETQVPMEEVNPRGIKDRNEYVNGTISDYPKVVENLKENGIQFGLHEKYRTRYTWRPKVILPEGCRMDWMAMTMYNGEAEELFDESFEKNEYRKRAIPKTIDMTWFDAKGEKFGSQMYLSWNEPETFEAFKQIFRNDKESKAELVLKVFQIKPQNAFKVYLRTEKEEFELEDTDNGAYSMDN
jgi:hypothetical protein